MNDVVTRKGSSTITEFINTLVITELKEEYPSIKLKDNIDIPGAIQEINKKTGDRFVFILDEYDVIIRDEEYSDDLKDYLRFLVSLFKNGMTKSAIAIAYLTGILHIIKGKTQSGLNNFTEYTMIAPDDMAPFMGFTEDEVKSLATQSGMAFDELKKWYDGYSLRGVEIYSPMSVITAVAKKHCNNYWTQTNYYDSLKDYIVLDFEGIKSDILRMISGSHVQVNVSKFSNSRIINSKDDVFTCLIHLGYLGYNYDDNTCFIPNYEISKEWINAIEDTPDYVSVIELIKDSKCLLESTWNGDEEAVAEGVGKAHMEACSILEYNNEGSFQSDIHLA